MGNNSTKSISIISIISLIDDIDKSDPEYISLKNYVPSHWNVDPFFGLTGTNSGSTKYKNCHSIHILITRYEQYEWIRVRMKKDIYNKFVDLAQNNKTIKQNNVSNPPPYENPYFRKKT